LTPSRQYCLLVNYKQEYSMDKKIAVLLGAVGALSSFDAAQAAVAIDPTTVLQAQTYADLLNPIPNAATTLKAVDEAGAPAPLRVSENSHHHHHHSSRRSRTVIVAPRRHHHHHHHHSMKIER
jgi:hypothetical protein